MIPGRLRSLHQQIIDEDEEDDRKRGHDKLSNERLISEIDDGDDSMVTTTTTTPNNNDNGLTGGDNNETTTTTSTITSSLYNFNMFSRDNVRRQLLLQLQHKEEKYPKDCSSLSSSLLLTQDGSGRQQQFNKTKGVTQSVASTIATTTMSSSSSINEDDDNLSPKQEGAADKAGATTISEGITLKKNK